MRNGLHQYTIGKSVRRLSDGQLGAVVEDGALYALIRTRGTFPETVEVEHGDPAWAVEMPSALRRARPTRVTMVANG